MPYRILALRLFMAIYVLVDGYLLARAIGGSAMGDASAAITVFEYAGEAPAPGMAAPLWGVIAVTALGLFYLWLLIGVFRSLDNLIVGAHRGALASVAMAGALRTLGRGLVLLWITLVAAETIVPLALFVPITEHGVVAFEPLGFPIVLALLGLALWLMAGLAEEAHAMKEELSGVV